MNLQNKLDELAYIKKTIKAQEARLDALQTEIMGDPEFDGEPTVTPFGTLSLARRSNYSTPENAAVIQELGKDKFMAIAKVSVGDLKKAGGDILIAKLLNQPGTTFVKKPDSIYFTLKEPKA